MICPRCGVRECKVRSNGRPLPACSECWGPRAEIGATALTAHGYRRIRTETGWRMEHIVVAEQVLGRPLHPDEHVGWADGDRLNNDPANLMLAVTRTRPLVEAPKRKRVRTGEKHAPRTEVRLPAVIREHVEKQAGELGQTFAATVAAYTVSGVLETMAEEDRHAYWVQVVREYREREEQTA